MSLRATSETAGAAIPGEAERVRFSMTDQTSTLRYLDTSTHAL